MSTTEYDQRRDELTAYAREVGGSPLPIEFIIWAEQRGYVVDFETGEVRPDNDRFSLTVTGEALAVIEGTGFLDDAAGARWP